MKKSVAILSLLVLLAGTAVAQEQTKVEFAPYAVVLAERGLDESLIRKNPPRLPEVSEREAVGHYTRLSTWNFSVPFDHS